MSFPPLARQCPGNKVPKRKRSPPLDGFPDLEAPAALTKSPAQTFAAFFGADPDVAATVRTESNFEVQVCSLASERPGMRANMAFSHRRDGCSIKRNMPALTAEETAQTMMNNTGAGSSLPRWCMSA